MGSSALGSGHTLQGLGRAFRDGRPDPKIRNPNGASLHGASHAQVVGLSRHVVQHLGRREGQG